MNARHEIADFIVALTTVYSIVIVAWILAQLVFSLGVRVPYSRWSDAILDFLRDSSTPYLRLFRWVPRLGMFDLSPIVALLALRIVGELIAGIVRGP